ncbi:hypothetical protein SA2016_0311 [Sinomonas atrocyanea]|uniref:Uncharacterized protein n=1 Tax=Sinomonas atrocyanea TaxID=37927 RepID=A0A127A068_9MICC|nr:hypothetical protein [Sinomonas atrocyanea]AMM31012.1 hypothetical protein SA2016_0311 [Sinomonas atrocyanea]GEB63256.1 hypothetical protein SAT01_07040 [Sinomonas atrocyanea]GGG69620.1 hypothetical protein GCM10007172_22210 [Sinomonas atrocyanea]
MRPHSCEPLACAHVEVEPGQSSPSQRVLTVAGCTAPLLCAEAESGPPAITLDATVWLHAHPGRILQACLASRCAQLTATVPTTILQAPASDTAGTYPLTVSASGKVLSNEAIHLADPTVSGPCGGARVAMTAHLTLDAIGRLTKAMPTPPRPRSAADS